MIVVAWSANTPRIEQSAAARYIGAGSGVARIRFRIPSSRLITRMIASPPNAVLATP
jgi:hypothetical protein